MFIQLKRFFLLALMLIITVQVQAATITYETNNIGGNTWQYDYIIENDSLALDIFEFSILFDPLLYANLDTAAAPSGWDSFILQPDTSIPADGIFGAFDINDTGISPGENLGGFSVRFDFFGNNEPGNQAFEIIDPFEFSVIQSGVTQLTPVPIPASLGLLASALLVLGGLKRIAVTWFKP